MPRPTKEVLQARIAHAREVKKQKQEEELANPEKWAMEDPTQELALRDHKWLGEPKKSLYIPSWYKPHVMNSGVTQNGQKLGFHVKDVMVHRRWAIQQNGELLDQRDFEPLYIQYISEICGKDVDPRLQHIPRVERYVNAKPDPRDGPGYVEIGYDPNVPPPKEDDGTRYDPIRDVIFSLRDDMERTRVLERKADLASMFERGEITPETFQKEMRALAPKVEFKEEATQGSA